MIAAGRSPKNQDGSLFTFGHRSRTGGALDAGGLVDATQVLCHWRRLGFVARRKDGNLASFWGLGLVT